MFHPEDCFSEEERLRRSLTHCRETRPAAARNTYSKVFACGSLIRVARVTSQNHSQHAGEETPPAPTKQVFSLD